MITITHTHTFDHHNAYTMKKLNLIQKTNLITSCAALFLITAAPNLAKAQGAGVTVAGDVEKPFTINASTFSTMKRITATIKTHDGKQHEYSGVSLYEILTKAGTVPNNLLKGKALAKYVLITAADKYQVVMALPEFDPAFTDQVIILADQEDGETLAPNLGPYRLMVPDDKKPARSVMRVTSIDVQTAIKK